MNDRDFMRETAKTENWKMMCYHMSTTVRVLGTDRANWHTQPCAQQVGPCGLCRHPETRFFAFLPTFKYPYEFQTPNPI